MRIEMRKHLDYDFAGFARVTRSQYLEKGGDPLDECSIDYAAPNRVDGALIRVY